MARDRTQFQLVLRQMVTLQLTSVGIRPDGPHDVAWFRVARLNIVSGLQCVVWYLYYNTELEKWQVLFGVADLMNLKLYLCWWSFLHTMIGSLKSSSGLSESTNTFLNGCLSCPTLAAVLFLIWVIKRQERIVPMTRYGHKPIVGVVHPDVIVRSISVYLYWQ